MKEIVVGIGEALWDMLPEGKKIGGAPANFAYHVSQFGLAGCAVSAVGNDTLGRELIETINKKNVNYSFEAVPYPTGTVYVEIDQNGIPQYDITENVAWDNIPYTPELEALANSACAACFGSLAQRSAVSRNTINRFLDIMSHTPGRLIVFDANLRQDFYDKETLHNSLRRSNVLKINDEELVIFSRLFGFPGIDMESKCRTLVKEYDLKMLILTCGVNGSYIFTPDAVSFQPTPIVKVADTVGAGDSFTAAFVANIIKGRTVEEAHRKAVETSAFVCTCQGAMPTLPPEITD